MNHTALIQHSSSITELLSATLRDSSSIPLPFMDGLPFGSLAAPFGLPLRSLRSLVVALSPLSAPVVPLRFARSPPSASQKGSSLKLYLSPPKPPSHDRFIKNWGETFGSGALPTPSNYSASGGGALPTTLALSIFPPFRRFAPPSPPTGGNDKYRKRASLLSLINLLLAFGLKEPK